MNTYRYNSTAEIRAAMQKDIDDIRARLAAVEHNGVCLATASDPMVVDPAIPRIPAPLPPPPPARVELFIDERERYVRAHSTELSAVANRTITMTTGDYAIVVDGVIKVIFERKTFADAAASMRDGRWENREKLYALRRETGCSVVFIIEDKAWFRDTYDTAMADRAMPYSAIESSLIHMMVRDDIRMIHTRDTVDTAKTLVRWVQSIERMNRSTAVPAPPVGAETATHDPSGSFRKDDASSLLTARQETPDHEYVRKMWSLFKKLGKPTAEVFMGEMSIHELLCGADFSHIRAANGRQLSIPVTRAIRDFAAGGSAEMERKMLAIVPGVSAATAEKLLENISLKRLLSYGVDGIAMKKTGARQFGGKKAAVVLRLFNYTTRVDVE